MKRFAKVRKIRRNNTKPFHVYLMGLDPFAALNVDAQSDEFEENDRL